MRLSNDATILWDTARALNRAAASISPEAAKLPPLIFITDPERTPEPWVAAERLPPGAAVIYRAFGAADAMDVGHRLRAATRAAGVRLLVGQALELARAVAADGVHLPERDLARGPEIRRTWPDALLTGAAHDASALKAAGEAGLDAAILSPVFTPGGASGLNGRSPLEPEGFEALALAAALPVYALGGISAANAGQLPGRGACGLCAVDAVRAAFILPA